MRRTKNPGLLRVRPPPVVLLQEQLNKDPSRPWREGLKLRPFSNTSGPGARNWKTVRLKPCVIAAVLVRIPSRAQGCSCKEALSSPKNENTKKAGRGNSPDRSIDRYANWITQADCKSVAFGHCRFESCSVDYICSSTMCLK